MKTKTIMELRIFKQLKILQTKLDKDLYEPVNNDDVTKLERVLQPFSVDLFIELAYHECYYNDQLGENGLPCTDDLTMVRVIADNENMRAVKLMMNSDLKEIVNDIALNIAYDLGVGLDLENEFSNY